MSDMGDFLLGIDLGTSSVKVLLTSLRGEIAGRGESSYPILSPTADRAEQDPEAWWKATIAAVGEALKSARDSDIRVRCIGLSGQMHGTVLVNGKGRPINPAVIWPDRRSKMQSREITRQVGSERLIDIAGSPVAAGFQAATVMWFQANRPDIWPLVHMVLLPKDYLRWRMTGDFATDHSDASGSLLYDLRRRQCSAELLNIVQIEQEKLPRIMASDQITGHLTKPAAADLGLAAGIPVAAGAGDVACGLIGAGVVDENDLLLTISTGGQIARPVSEPASDNLGRIHTFSGALRPGKNRSGFMHLGAILSAGRSLAWLRDQIFESNDRADFDHLERLAMASPCGSKGLLFLPYLTGERTPHMNPDTRGMFLGLTLRHGKGEIVRAVMEGVSMACYEAFAVLQELGAEPERMVMSGGGAQSPLWRQIVADTFNLPVVSPIVIEQAAYGAAILAGAGAGSHHAYEASCLWTRYHEPVHPDPISHRRYRRLLDIFRSAYRSVEEL